MKKFSSFVSQLDELTGVAPKSKGEHKFVHSTYLAQIKDPGDLEKVGPEEVGPHNTKLGSGKRPADRLDNKQKFGESVDLEENYRSLAQKGIGAETKGSIKVGHGVDYYHPKNGDKHMGKIHSMSGSGYVVKDDKTGEKHSFDYFRKEDVEIDGEQIDERNKENADRRKMMDAERGSKFKAQGHPTPGPTSKQKDDQSHSKMIGRAIRKMSNESAELDEAAYTGKGNNRPGWMLRADPKLAKKFKEKEDITKKRQAAYGNPAAGKSVKEESELEEADFSKSQTTMAHAIGKHFKKKGVGDESKGGPFAVASAMVRDKPAAAKKAYATIKAKMKNEDHQDMLMALYDSLNEENQGMFESMIETDAHKLLAFAESVLLNKE
jgi:hypothetical protein